MGSDSGNFLQFANPGAWLRSAEDLFEQAQNVFETKGQSIVAETDVQGNVTHRLDGADRTCFLLCGFAIENLLKGLLIHQEPNHVSSGRLSRQITTHDLPRLLRALQELSIPRSLEVSLQEFSEGIVSWARYPCALSKDASGYPPAFSESHWQNFVSLFRLMSESLKTKLTAGWDGPEGYYGNWTFEDMP